MTSPRGAMWARAGPGWWPGRTLAAWASRSAGLGPPGALPASALGPAAEPRAPDRPFSSADRQVTPPEFLLGQVLKLGKVLLLYLGMWTQVALL